jgi:hypothetical protein
MIVSVCISQFSLLSRNTQGLFLYKEKRLYNLLNNSVGVVLALVWFGSGKHDISAGLPFFLDTIKVSDKHI